MNQARILMRRGVAVLLCAVGLLAVPVAAQAQQPPPPPAPAGDARPVVIARGALRSYEAFQKAAEQLGIPIPPEITPQGIEREATFLGAGGLDTTRPIAVVFFANTKLPLEDSVAVLVPVRAGAAPIEAIRKFADAKPLAGHEDTVVIDDGETAMRRSRDHVIFGPAIQGVATLDPAIIADVVPDAGTLVRFEIDAKAVRAHKPDMVGQLVTALRELGTDLPSLAPLTSEAVKFVSDRVTRVGLSLDHGAAGLRVGVTLEPMELPAVTPGAAAASLPANTFFRLDLGAPLNKINPLVTEERIRGELLGMLGANPDPRERQWIDLYSRAFTLIASAETTSVGMEMGAGQPVVYIVQRHAKPFNVAHQLQRINDFFVQAATEAGTKPATDLNFYETQSTRVHRLRFLQEGAAVLNVDVAQRDNTIYYTVTPTEHRWMDKLLLSKPEAAMQHVATLTLDLEKLVRTADKIPKGPLTTVPPEVAQRIRQALQQQKIIVALGGKGTSATLEATVPTEVLKLLISIGMEQMEAEAPKPGDAAPRPLPPFPPPPGIGPQPAPRPLPPTPPPPGG